MRRQVIRFLNEKIYESDWTFLTSDLGYGLLDELAKKLGDRFVNCGVAESNMMSVAAGMSAVGSKAITYSISSFAALRCLEQIRNDICYHRSNVLMLSIGPGFTYGNQGMSHHCLEDLAVMCAIPNLKVYNPANQFETELCMRKAWQSSEPTYCRLGLERGEQVLSFDSMAMEPLMENGFVEWQKGSRATIISSGSIVQDLLAWVPEDIQIISVYELKPFPAQKVLSAITSSKLLIVDESFGPSVMSQHLKANRLLQIQNRFPEEVGDEEFLRQQLGLGKADIQRELECLLS